MNSSNNNGVIPTLPDLRSHVTPTLQNPLPTTISTTETFLPGSSTDSPTPSTASHNGAHDSDSIPPHIVKFLRRLEKRVLASGKVTSTDKCNIRHIQSRYLSKSTTMHLMPDTLRPYLAKQDQSGSATGISSVSTNYSTTMAPSSTYPPEKEEPLAHSTTTPKLALGMSIRFPKLPAAIYASVSDNYNRAVRLSRLSSRSVGHLRSLIAHLNIVLQSPAPISLSTRAIFVRDLLRVYILSDELLPEHFTELQALRDQRGRPLTLNHRRIRAFNLVRKRFNILVDSAHKLPQNRRYHSTSLVTSAVLARLDVLSALRLLAARLHDSNNSPSVINLENVV